MVIEPVRVEPGNVFSDVGMLGSLYALYPFGVIGMLATF